MFPRPAPSDRPVTWRSGRSWISALVVATLVGCAATEEGAAPTKDVQSRIETDPPGASIFVDGGFVGTTPTAFRLPPKQRVQLRLDLPGHFPVDTVLERAPGVAESAGPGVGWEPFYYFPLRKK